MQEQPKSTCRRISGDSTYEGKQGLTYTAAVSAQSVGTQRLCMHLLTIPPGGRARAHLHQDHETALYVLSGEGGMWFGENLEEHLLARASDFVYIPAGIPHLPYNASQTESVVAVLARTDPDEQESVVLLPELDRRFDKAAPG